MTYIAPKKHHVRNAIARNLEIMWDHHRLTLALFVVLMGIAVGFFATGMLTFMDNVPSTNLPAYSVSKDGGPEWMVLSKNGNEVTVCARGASNCPADVTQSLHEFLEHENHQTPLADNRRENLVP